MTGDVVVLGMMSDNPDEFSWVPLVDVAMSDVIYFTDTGYFSSADNAGNPDDFEAELAGGAGVDILIQFTASSAITAGTVQTVDLGNFNTGDYALIGNASAPTFTDITGATLDFRPTGDSIYIFTAPTAGDVANDPATNLTSLFALNSEQSAFGANTVNHAFTSIPPGLTDGTNAVALGFDNVRYVGTEGRTTTNTRDEILAPWPSIQTGRGLTLYR